MAQIQKLIQENQKLKYQLEKFKSSNGLLPYIDDSAIKGGYHVVKNISERDSIDCCHRKLGMKVLVIGSDLSFKEYILKTDNCKENIWKEVDVTIEENEVFLIEDYSELSENLTTQKELNLILKQLILNLQTALDEKQDILTENNVGQFMELELSTKSTPTSGDTVLGKDSLTGKAVEIPTSSLVEIVDVSNLVPYTGANKDVNIASHYFKTSKGFDFTFDVNNYFNTYHSDYYSTLKFKSKDSSDDNFGYLQITANAEEGFTVNCVDGNEANTNFLQVNINGISSSKVFESGEGFKTPFGTSNQALTADGGVFDLNTKADLVGGNLFKGDQVLQNSKLISNNYGTYSRFTLNRASNSLTTPTIPSSGTRLGEINFGSYNGTTFANVSQIASFVDATSGVGDLPSKLVFYTTPDNSSTLTERMSINNLGRIRIGSTMNYSDALNIESGHIAFQNGFGIRSYNTTGSIYAILYTSNDKVIIKSLGDGVQIKNRANTESLINITDGGNVSLGVVNPTEKLEVNGGVRALAFSTPDGTANQALTANGGVFDLSTKADLVGGKVPAYQLPAYVDDVLEFANLASFPATGESGKIYIALDTNLTYRWGGSSYVIMTSSLALGETSSTAYRGDRGKIAYDHSQANGNPHGTTKNDIGLGNVDNTSDLDKPISTATQTALDAKLSIETTSITGTEVSFTNDRIYGSLASPETANITANTTNAKLGVTNIIIHNSVTAPTFGSQFKKLSGSGNYATGVVNYIYCTYISATEIIYSINQRA